MAKQCSKCGKKLAFLENFGNFEKPLCSECGKASKKCIKCQKPLKGDDDYGFSDIKIINNECYCEECYQEVLKAKGKAEQSQKNQQREEAPVNSNALPNTEKTDLSVIQFDKVYAHTGIIPSFHFTVAVNIIGLAATIYTIFSLPLVSSGDKFIYSIVAIFVVVNFMIILRFVCEALLTIFNIWIKVKDLKNK
ncbi:MAG: hypothetical protein ABSE00_00075 [Chitinispirillaceae bacterium]|jgi:predicted RNA-binding Zn-ribbon protein involved in translation (DUF1610 family)